MTLSFRSVAVVWGLGALIGTLCVASAGAQSLRGSRTSLDRQTRQAHGHDFTYLAGPTQLRRFVDVGLLVPVGDTRDYRLEKVSFPVVRPEVKLFIERLAAQYPSFCSLGRRHELAGSASVLGHHVIASRDRKV